MKRLHTGYNPHIGISGVFPHQIMVNNQVFKACKGYYGYYVSQDAQVFSLMPTRFNKPPKLVKQRMGYRGMRIELRINKRKVTMYTEKLVKENWK